MCGTQGQAGDKGKWRSANSRTAPHLRASLVAVPIDCARSSCCWPWLSELASDWAVVRVAASWAASWAGSDSADLEACSRSEGGMAGARQASQQQSEG